ncbi:carbonic anhydrase [soil metagenome]
MAGATHRVDDYRACMDLLEQLVANNQHHAQDGFVPGLKMLPTGRTMIIGCVDPRVDPMDVLGLQPGQAAIIRNVGGRVTPALLQTLGILRVVTQSAGGTVGDGWNLIVLQHTDCGIAGCLRLAPALIANYMGVDESGLDALSITEPRGAVIRDVAALKANPNLPGGFMVTGMVYDVATGLVETVVPPALLRAATT